MKITCISIEAAVFLLAAAISTQLHAGQYFQDFSGSSVGATSFADGSTLFSTSLGNAAAVQDGNLKELQLTEISVNNVTSALELADLDPGDAVYAFSVRFYLQVYGNFPSAADGFSLNFGQLASVNLTNGPVESGYGTGLCFSAQTYGGNNPGFFVRVNGATYYSQTNNPVTQWGWFNNTRHLVEVDWNYAAGLTVRIDGQGIFTNVPTYGFTPTAGDRFVWAARCGGLSQRLSLDNILVMTGGNLAQVPATSPFYSNQGSNPSGESDKAFDGIGSTYWVTFSNTGYVGAAVSPRSVAGAYVLVSSPDPGTGSATDPRSWTLQGLNNDSTNWISCGTGSGYFANRQEARVWPATNSTVYRAYRLSISQNNGAGAVALGELRFYRFIPFGPKAWTANQVPVPPQSPWDSIAMSADGTKMVAASEGGGASYTNSGLNWNLLGGVRIGIRSVASSSNGNTIALASGLISEPLFNGDYLVTSTNAGATWITNFSAGRREWRAVALLADGSESLAAAADGKIISGAFATTLGANAVAVASSADGNVQVVMLQDSAPLPLGQSTPFIVSRGHSAFTPEDKFELPLDKYGPNCIALSANGTNMLLASGGNHKLFRSINAGQSWAQVNGVPDNYWRAVASSADGTKLFAASVVSEGGYISPLLGWGDVFASYDSGATWTSLNFNLNASPPEWPNAIACSADGSKLALCGRNIWTYGTVLVASPPPPPTATTLFATNVSLTGATLNAQVTPANLDTSAWLEWGVTTNYGNVIALQDLGPTPTPRTIQANLSGLSPGTTYHYRVVAVDSLTRADGLDRTFTTLWGLPAVTTLSVSQLTFSRATLNGQATPNLLAAAAWFQWGTTTSYGNLTAKQGIGSGSSAVAISATLSNLVAGVYHFRSVATNSVGTNYGADVAFTIRPTNAFFNLILPDDLVIPSSFDFPAGQGADKAIDGTPATKYLNSAFLYNPGFTVFPTITNVPVRALGLISAEDAPERDPASFVLFGSKDGVNFTQIASNAIPPFISRNAIQSIEFANTNTYLAYKILFPTVRDPNSANAMQIAEVELLPNSDITSAGDGVGFIPLTGQLTAASTGPGLLDRMLNQATNKIVVVNELAGALAFVVPAAGGSIVKGFELIGGYDDTNIPGRTPSGITLAGSDDGTNFVFLAAVTPQTPTANMQVQGFSMLGNTNAYKLYQVFFGAPQSGTVLQIGELRLFGVTASQLSVSASGSNLLLSWPVSGFILQQSSNLTNWVVATNEIAVTNGQSQIAAPRTGGNNFYRLKSQ